MQVGVSATEGSGAVIVTGASSGIGHGVALDLAKRGHPVIAAMRAAEGRNAEAARGLQNAYPGRIRVIEMDVADEASVAAGMAQALSRSEPIAGLVNCAGVMWTGLTEGFTQAQFEAVLQTNLLGPFRVARAVLPRLRSQGSGLIVWVTSIAGRLIVPGYGLYNASKMGLEGLAEAWALELAPMGIDNTIVEPGPFATRLKANSRGPDDQQIVEAYGGHGRPDVDVVTALTPTIAAAKDQLDPAICARRIAGLFALPAGQRPSGSRSAMTSEPPA